MTDIKKYLLGFLNDLDRFSFPDYEKFPDIDLYMDQMINYLERNLNIYQTSTLDKQITPSMINNYVKGEVIPAPILKKYTREHLALLKEICVLKQVLSLNEIKQLMDGKPEFNHFKEIYEKIKKEAIEYALAQLETIENNDVSVLKDLAIKFAITAQNYLLISKRILFLCKLFDEGNKTEY